MQTIFCAGKQIADIIVEVKRYKPDEVIRLIYPDTKETTKTQAETLKDLEELVQSSQLYKRGQALSGPNFLTLKHFMNRIHAVIEDLIDFDYSRMLVIKKNNKACGILQSFGNTWEAHINPPQYNKILITGTIVRCIRALESEGYEVYSL